MTVETADRLDRRPPPRTGHWVKPRPQVGLGILLLAGAFPVRFSIGGGRTGSLFDLAVGLCAIQYLWMLGTLPTLPLPPRRLLVAMIVPGVLALVSLVWSQRFGLTLLTGISWVEAVVVVLFTTAVLRDQYPSVVIKWMARFGLLLLVAPVLLYLHVPGFGPPAEIDPTTGDYLSYYVRLSHPFIGRSNNLATLLAILFLPLVYWASRYRSHRVAASLTGVAIVLTLSRGVLLAVILGGFLLVVRTRKQAMRVLRRLLGPALLGVVGLLIAVLYDPAVAGQIATRATATTVTDRQDLISAGWVALSRQTWLGVGAGVGGSVHNTYLQQLVYFGVPLGLLSVWALIRMPRWFFSRDGSAAGDLSRAAGLGVVAAWVSFLAESSLEGSLLRPLIFLCVGLCLALAQSARTFSPLV